MLIREQITLTTGRQYAVNSDKQFLDTKENEKNILSSDEQLVDSKSEKITINTDMPNVCTHSNFQ